MLFPQEHLLSSLPHRSKGHDLSHVPDNELGSDNSAPVRDTQSDQAIVPTDDAAEFDFSNETMSRLFLLMDQLNEATSRGDLEELLEAIESFAVESNSRLIAGLLDEVQDLLRTTLGAVSNDAAFAGGFDFSFNVNVVQNSFSSEDYQQNLTSLSFSFSLKTDDTVLMGQATFGESYTITDNGISYASIESVTVSVVTFNADVNSNSVLDGFFDIASRLLDDFAKVVAPEEAQPAITDQTEQQEEQMYYPISVNDLLNIEYHILKEILRENSYLIKLLEMLKAPAEQTSNQPSQAETQAA